MSELRGVDTTPANFIPNIDLESQPFVKRGAARRLNYGANHGAADDTRQVLTNAQLLHAKQPEGDEEACKTEQLSHASSHENLLDCDN